MDIFQQQRRIILASTLAVIASGMLIATAVSLPLVSQIRDQIIELAETVADSKATTIKTIFDRKTGIAQQTASRTEVGRVLLEYDQGLISHDQLREFTEPRLRDAIADVEHLAALIRYDQNQQEVVRVGPLADQLPEHILIPEPLSFRQYELSDANQTQLLLHVFEEIQFYEQSVGYDLLLFYPDPLVEIFRLTEDSVMCMVHKGLDQRAALSPKSEYFKITSSTSCLTALTEANRRTHFGMMGDGTRILTFTRPLKDLGWILNVRTDRSNLFGNLARQFVIISLAIISLSLISGLLLRRYLKPLLNTITDQASQIAQSSEDLRLAHLVVDNTSDAALITDANFNLTWANRAFKQLGRFSMKPKPGVNFTEFLHSISGRKPSVGNLKSLLEKESSWTGDITLKSRPKLELPFLLTVSPIKGATEHNEGFVLTLTNIADRVQKEREVRFLADHDTLTGLPNRLLLNKKLQQRLDHSGISDDYQFAVMFLDLDKFKPVNDNLGHEMGDKLLVNIARRVTNCLRDTDVLGRQGGDEFVVITDVIKDKADAKTIAGKVLEVLNEPFHIDEHILEIGVSIGVALYPKHGRDSETLLRRADAAMYRVKSTTRNAVAFYK